MYNIEEALKRNIDELLKNPSPELLQIINQYKDSPEKLAEILSDVVGDVVDKVNPYKWPIVTPLEFIENPYYCGVNPETDKGVCKTIHPKLKEEFCFIHDRKNQIAEIVESGCVDLDSIIQEADGGLPTLRERIGKDSDVLVVKENGLEISETINSRHSGVQKVIKITLANGMELKLTPDHRIDVFTRKRKWIESQNIKIGHRVVVPRIIKTTPSTNTTNEMARFYAYVIANGSFDRYRFRVDSSNEKAIRDVKSCVEKFGFVGNLSHKNGAMEFHSEKYCRSGFKKFITEKFGERKSIIVPAEVCKSSNEVVANFLNALFAVEGCVYVPQTPDARPLIQVAMIDEIFIRQIQLLLLRFGIQSKIKHLRQFDKRSNVERFIWTLVISGINNLKKFLGEIGLVIGKEDKCLSIKKYCDDKTPNTNVDVIPLTGCELSHLMTEMGIVRNKDNYWWSLASRKNYLSFDTFALWLKEYGDTKLGRILRRIFPSDVSYIPVVKIEQMDEPIEVGDIGAFNGNRFISNGMSVHNSIGWGKSWFTSLCLVWEIYTLSCLKSPQNFFGLAEASEIVVLNISITEKQAKNKIFATVKEMISTIPYFQERFMFDKRKEAEELLFPSNIKFAHGTSSHTSTIGLDIYAAALDEANFFKVVQQSKKSTEADGNFDQAMTLYLSLVRRLKARFHKGDQRPGKIYLASSSVQPNDFTSQRIKASMEAGDKSTYVMSHNLWKVNRNKYSKEEFFVEVGGLNRKSRILNGDEKDITGKVIAIPMDFHMDFKKDLDNAIRDIAGEAVYAVNPFFGNRAKIASMFEKGKEFINIFSKKTATLSPKPEFLMIERILSHKIRNPQQPRYIGIDIGLRKDSFGFAMGHIESMVNVERSFFDDETQNFTTSKERVPHVAIEFVLEVVKEEEFGEVELSRVRSLIYNLRRFGYKIRYGFIDGFESTDMMQILKRKNILLEYNSMDKKTEAYETARSAIYEDRVSCYHHPKLEIEMNELEMNYITGKVDHPIRGSKDLSDAVCQVIYNCNVNPHFFDESLLPINFNASDNTEEKTQEEYINEFEDWVKGVKK